MLMFSESHAQPHSSHLISLLCAKPAPSRLSSLLSALPSSCCYKPLLAHKSLFSFVIRWKSSSFSSSFFVFFNGHSSVIFFFKFYLSNLIKKYILKVEFWSTKHQATLICYQKPLGTNIDLNFFFLTYHFFFFFFSDLACFVLAKDLFVLLPGTEKNLWVHAL